MKTSDIVLGKRFKGMFVGSNGSGKTRAAGSFPGPIYFFDFDDRMSTLAKDFKDRTDIEFDTYGLSNFDSFEKKLDKLQDKCPYNLVVIDSITSETTTAVLYSLGITGGKKIAGFNVPDFGEYGVETTLLTKTCEILKQLPCHVIVTAHPIDRISTQGQGKAMKVQKIRSIVSYGSKLSSIIPNYFDEIYAFQTGIDQHGKISRLVYTSPSEDEILAKTSLPLPTSFDITGRNFYETLKTILSQGGIELK